MVAGDIITVVLLIFLFFFIAMLLPMMKNKREKKKNRHCRLGGTSTAPFAPLMRQTGRFLSIGFDTLKATRPSLSLSVCVFLFSLFVHSIVSLVRMLGTFLLAVAAVRSETTAA